MARIVKTNEGTVFKSFKSGLVKIWLKNLQNQSGQPRQIRIGCFLEEGDKLLT
jgi:hypothetical protein